MKKLLQIFPSTTASSKHFLVERSRALDMMRRVKLMFSDSVTETDLNTNCCDT